MSLYEHLEQDYECFVLLGFGLCSISPLPGMLSKGDESLSRFLASVFGSVWIGSKKILIK